jgi:hypothetical protein
MKTKQIQAKRKQIQAKRKQIRTERKQIRYTAPPRAQTGRREPRKKTAASRSTSTRCEAGLTRSGHGERRRSPPPVAGHQTQLTAAGLSQDLVEKE